MNMDEFERLAVGYLHRELDSADVANLRQHLEAHPEGAARILQLADQELLLTRGLAVAKSSRGMRSAVAPVSRHLSQRASRRGMRARNPFSPMRIALGIAALLALCFFIANSFPSKSLQPIATLDASTGNTMLIRDGETKRATAGTRLTAQDRIRTTDGQATIAYPDGTIVRLSGSTSVHVGESVPGKHLTLLEGSLACNAAKQPAGAPFILRSPQTEAMVIGTVFKFSVASGTTVLQVDEGLVNLTDLATHQSVQCSAGETAAADNKSKLAVTKSASQTAEVAEADTYSQEFPNESSFEKGRLDVKDAPPGGVGSVSEMPLPGTNQLFIMQSKVSNEKPLFVVHDDDVIHVTYRSERIGDFTGFELFLCIFPKEGWATECNVISRVTPASTAWVTVDLPLSKFNNVTGNPQKLDGMVCRSFFVQTFNYSGIKVAKFWVTREKISTFDSRKP